ncbi:uncharacterized protein J5F26_007497 isoform 2-T5 [Ciconia maguari]
MEPGWSGKAPNREKKKICSQLREVYSGSGLNGDKLTSFPPEKSALTVASSAELWSCSGRVGDLPITQFLKKETKILVRTANITMETPKNKDFPSLVRAHLQEQELPVKSDSPSLLVSPKDIFLWTGASCCTHEKFSQRSSLVFMRRNLPRSAQE